MSKIGLYIHIPFCQKKCFYCSFIVAIGQKKYKYDYAESLLQELHQHHSQEIGSIYFGGGTPSQLSEEYFSLLMEDIKEYFCVVDGVEITVEMNPEDVTAKKLTCYRDHGVNRISLGVQSFHNNYLALLGRCHDAQQARDAYDLIRDHCFNNVSIDVMYGFPGQSLDDIQQDLDVLGQMGPDHVSLYSLTIEPGSKFFVHQTPLPTQEQMVQQYVFVRKYLMDQGYEHYEVSNFARPGKRSAHNMNYWQGGNYIGLGVGAHSHMDGRRWWNVTRIRDYLERMQCGQSVEEGHEQLTQVQRLSEALVFGLRMCGGVDVDDLQQQYGRLSEKQKKSIAEFVEQGYLKREGNFLKPMLSGVLVLDELAPRLL